MFSDASLYKYGGRVNYEGKVIKISEFWEQDDDRAIHLKEAEEVFMVLLALGGSLMNPWVRVLTDNMAVLSVWQNQGAWDSALNQITKITIHLALKENCEIQMQYFPSVDDIADVQSRSII